MIAFASSLGACGEQASVADAGAKTSSPTPDAGPSPFFRDAGGGCGGPSGTSGSGNSGSGTSGTSGEGCTATELADAAPPPCDYHNFTYAGEATTVWVTGSFTGWAESPPDGAWVLTRGSDNVFRRGDRLGAGRHLYKLIIDGTTWIADASNPTTEPDGLGGSNSVIEACGAPN